MLRTFEYNNNILNGKDVSIKLYEHQEIYIVNYGTQSINFVDSSISRTFNECK